MTLEQLNDHDFRIVSAVSFKKPDVNSGFTGRCIVKDSCGLHYICFHRRLKDGSKIFSEPVPLRHNHLTLMMQAKDLKGVN